MLRLEDRLETNVGSGKLQLKYQCPKSEIGPDCWEGADKQGLSPGEGRLMGTLSDDHSSQPSISSPLCQSQRLHGFTTFCYFF